MQVYILWGVIFCGAPTRNTLSMIFNDEKFLFIPFQIYNAGSSADNRLERRQITCEARNSGRGRVS